MKAESMAVPTLGTLIHMDVIDNSSMSSSKVFGNIMLERYLRNSRWVKGATSADELTGITLAVPPVKSYFAVAVTLSFVGFSVFAACFSGCP
jgi:hypothetical protein